MIKVANGIFVKEATGLARAFRQLTSGNPATRAAGEIAMPRVLMQGLLRKNPTETLAGNMLQLAPLIQRSPGRAGKELHVLTKKGPLVPEDFGSNTADLNRFISGVRSPDGPRNWRDLGRLALKHNAPGIS